jgi:hypothetical protein
MVNVVLTVLLLLFFIRRTPVIAFETDPLHRRVGEDAAWSRRSIHFPLFLPVLVEVVTGMVHMFAVKRYILLSGNFLLTKRKIVWTVVRTEAAKVSTPHSRPRH